MLRFLAVEGHAVREAGLGRQQGAAARYYGYTFDPSVAGEFKYSLSKEAFAVPEGGEDADKCAKACRKGALMPADEATASAVGVPFKAAKRAAESKGSS